MKLKIGNDLLQRFKKTAANEGKMEELQEILSELGLEKNRKSERIIYGELRGGDVTKFG